MKRIVSLIALTGLLLGVVQAQDKAGGISVDMLKTLRTSYQPSAAEKAIQNAVSNIGIGQLAATADKNIDTYFSNRVISKGISDQKSSGRCWMFTGFNVLRAKMISKYNLGAFQFSHNYLFFYDQLEKANLFLELMIANRDKVDEDQTITWLFKNAIGDGGQFTGVSDLLSKYGCVPAEVMPENKNSNNTGAISNLLSLKLREFGLDIRNNAKQSTEQLRKKKQEMLKEVYRMLVIAFGQPPAEFEYTMRDAKGKVISTKTYTPQSFYKEYINEELTDNYVMLMNDPTREYYKLYEIEYDRHVYDGYNWVYINLPMEEIQKIAIASIKDSVMMYYSCDVGKFLNRDNGMLDIANYDYASLMGVSFNMDKKERIQTYASGSSHAMTLCAVDLDNNGKPIKWMVENSWGPSYGYQGHLIMTDEWFREYTFRLVAEKKYISPEILKVLDQKPILLPPWDPMFQSEIN